jgi:hypothetical protein
VRDRLKRVPSPALVIAFIALVAALGTGTGVALTGTNTVTADDIRRNAVGASEIKRNAVRSAEIRRNAVRSSEVGDNSLTGADIDESTLSIPGGGGGGGGGGGLQFQSFNDTLGANETLTRTIGNFTITSATNGAGQCGPINLQAGDLDSQRSLNHGAFANLAANTTFTLTNANTSPAFAAVSDNGASTTQGVVGRAQQGATCLLTGYLTGN